MPTAHEMRMKRRRASRAKYNREAMKREAKRKPASGASAGTKKLVKSVRKVTRYKSASGGSMTPLPSTSDPPSADVSEPNR